MFIKYCVFSLICSYFSELCQAFGGDQCANLGVRRTNTDTTEGNTAYRPIHTHCWQDQSPEYIFKSAKNTIFNEHKHSATDDLMEITFIFNKFVTILPISKYFQRYILQSKNIIIQWKPSNAFMQIFPGFISLGFNFWNNYCLCMNRFGMICMKTLAHKYCTKKDMAAPL